MLAGRRSARRHDRPDAGYTWHPLTLGGGGFVTGLAFHPTDGDVRYVRTDVGGAYKRDPQTGGWQRITTADRIPGIVAGDYNVESLVVSAANPDVVIMLTGYDTDTSATGTGRVLVSTDGAASFTVSDQRFWVNGNGDGRQGGERLAISPTDPSTVFLGTRQQGLWVSQDTGVTWTQVPSAQVPAGTSPNGVQFVAFDPYEASVVYASVAGVGIYRSVDGGATWAPLFSGAETGYSIGIARDHTVYVGFRAAVRRLDPATGQWTVISPRADKSWQVAVDPDDSGFVYATPAGMNGKLYRSHDSGATWTNVKFGISSPTIPWITQTNETDYFTTAALRFDPQAHDQLWLAQGVGLWRASDLDASRITWQNESTGIENTDTTDVVAPPGGGVVTNIFDRQGFYYPDADSTPTAPLVDNEFWGGTGLDYSGRNPQHLVTVQARNNYYPSLIGRAAYSSDGGVHWTVLHSPVADIGPGGNIAVSATDPTNVVWLPSTGTMGAGKTPYHTTDNGTSWGTSGGINSTNTHTFFWWGGHRALESDKVLGGTFYVVTSDDNGAFYRSTDGGATFQRMYAPRCTSSESCQIDGQLRAAPGLAGNVWSSAVNGGLRYTFDGGVTPWSKAPHLQVAGKFGFGAPMPGSSYPTIYVNGNANGDLTPAFYRSTDYGQTWQKIADYPLGIAHQVATVNGDMNVPGRVYIGFVGEGFVVGDTTEQWTATTTSLTVPASTQEGSAVTLSASVSPATATGAVEFRDDTTVLGQTTVSGGTAVLELPGGLLSGSHPITATYIGDDTYAASTSAPGVVEVVGAPQQTTTAVSATSATGKANEPVVLAATVSAADSTVPTGSVEFTATEDGSGTSVPIATVPVSPDGSHATAQVTTTALGAGAWTVTGAFTGTGTYQDSTGTSEPIDLAPAGTPGGASTDANVDLVVEAAALTITTPWTPGNVLHLGHLVLDPNTSTLGLAAPVEFASATDQAKAITITDTRPGSPAFTAQVAATDFSGSQTGSSIPAGVAGLVDLHAQDVPGSPITAAEVQVNDVPALSGAGQTFATYDGDRSGTTWISGNVRITGVPAATAADTYRAVITLTVF